MRLLVETIIGLSIAVSLVRGLATEGYMISTGSMAPTLVGFHRDAECPHCRFAFDRGSVPAAIRSRHAETGASDASEDQTSEPARCPNCGERFALDPAASPRIEGDQLLVLKHAYADRPPRRWEVVVFRNPSDPSEAYIKRVAGLPGETVAIRHGDVFADGSLCRKDWATQQAMRLPIADSSHPIDDQSATSPQPSRWDIGPRWMRSTEAGEVVFDHGGEASAIRYRHRTRSGGQHRTRVQVDWPNPHPPEASRLRYENGELTCIGAMPEAVRDRLLLLSTDDRFRNAIRRLAAASRFGWITDACGYNPPGQSEHPVRDLMWEGRVHLAADAALSVRLLYGRQPFVLEMRPDRLRLLTLDADGGELVLRESSRPPVTGWQRVAVSLFDRQATVAIDGEPVWTPVPFASTALTERPSREPLTLTAAGRVRLVAPTLWRDVYVTPPDDAAAVTLPGDAFYMLGDNSPVSVDSRRWPIAAVPRSHLIGKPLMVHLPSRKVDAPLAGWLRVPDIGRMRLVR